MGIKMTHYRFLTSVVGLVAVGLCGCARVDPAHDYERVGGETKAAVGAYDTYDPAAESAISERVVEILEDGLTVDEAVQIALVNNPALQASYMSIGMARADVVQSRLLANPVLGLSLQLPEAGGRANLQASIAQSIVELWQIPVKARGAERELDGAILRLAREAASLAMDAKSAYWQAVGASASHAISIENRDLAKKLVDAALARQKAGAVGELDVNLARGTFLAAELEVTQARLDASTRRRALATVLGLTVDADSLMLLSDMDMVDLEGMAAEGVVETALEARLDLRAAEQAMTAAAARLKLEYARVFPEVSLGIMLEREHRRAQKGRKIFADTLKSSVANGGFTAPDLQSRGERNLERRADIDAIVGPSLSIELPIFDQNQAQIAKAKYEYDQTAKTYESIQRRIVQDVRQAFDAALTTEEVARFYDGTLLPQAQTNLDLSRETYQAGRTSLVTVIEAQRSLLDSRRAGVSAKQSAMTAAAELEREMGRPLGGKVNATDE